MPSACVFWENRGTFSGGSSNQSRFPEFSQGAGEMFLREFMLPDMDDGPSVLAKQPVLKAVPPFVAFDLCFPPLMPGCRDSPSRIYP
jgi:hypothetical protein